MGVQDRDWYWKDREAKRRADEEAAAAAHAERRASRDPEAMIRRINRSGPKLWGSDWHWTIQLLVWLAIVALLAIIWRMTR